MLSGKSVCADTLMANWLDRYFSNVERFKDFKTSWAEHNQRYVREWRTLLTTDRCSSWWSLCIFLNWEFHYYVQWILRDLFGVGVFCEACMMETGLALAPSAASPSSMGRQEMAAAAISTKYSRSNDMALTPKQRGIRHSDEGSWS